MKKIRLSIPKPCHENWHAMTPTEKGKFCASCQKTVMDFTGMSDRQLAEFFKKPSGSVCGRFCQEQLERDIKIPVRRIPWIKYFFQFSLPAFLISMKTSGQSTIIKGDVMEDPKAITQIPTVPSENKSSIGKPKAIRGKVVDENGMAVAFATISVKGSNRSVACDDNGVFKLYPKAGKDVLIVTAIGFQETEVTLSGDWIVITMMTISKQMDSVIVYSSDYLHHRMGAMGAVTVSYWNNPLKKLMDTASKKFSVYPNPVQRNSSVKIDFKKLDQGEYRVSVINIAGEVIQNEQISIQSKKQSAELQLKGTTEGTYVVRLVNTKTLAAYSEKIIVD